MFGDEAALKESASDILLERVRRAFKAMDGGAEENGFIQVTQLETFLRSLDLSSYSDHQIQTLAASMEVHGAGIILWEDLWKRTSRLLTGASLESVLQGNDDKEDSHATSNGGTMVSLQDEQEPQGGLSMSDASIQPATMSDEELARRLQAEWNGEAIDVTPDPPSIRTSPTTTTTTAFASDTDTARSSSEQLYGHTFQLYHYNGLYGGTLKPFRVTRMSADEAIGASVSLGASSHASLAIAGIGGDLEDVLRTKWYVHTSQVVCIFDRPEERFVQ
jgi:hypothetical protein